MNLMIRALLALGLSGLMCACSGAAADFPGSSGAAGEAGEAGGASEAGALASVGGGVSSAGGAGAPMAVAAAGAGGEAPMAAESGAGGMSAAGTAGAVEQSAGAPGAGSAGASTVEPMPGALWSECAQGDACQAPANTCGEWVANAGGSPARLCTFGCWSLQAQAPGKPPKMAPDSQLTAQCATAGGVCYSASAAYPVCVPHEPS